MRALGCFAGIVDWVTSARRFDDELARLDSVFFPSPPSFTGTANRGFPRAQPRTGSPRFSAVDIASGTGRAGLLLGSSTSEADRLFFLAGLGEAKVYVWRRTLAKSGEPGSEAGDTTGDPGGDVVVGSAAGRRRGVGGAADGGVISGASTVGIARANGGVSLDWNRRPMRRDSCWTLDALLTRPTFDSRGAEDDGRRPWVHRRSSVAFPSTEMAKSKIGEKLLGWAASESGREVDEWVRLWRRTGPKEVTCDAIPSVPELGKQEQEREGERARLDEDRSKTGVARTGPGRHRRKGQQEFTGKGRGAG